MPISYGQEVVAIVNRSELRKCGVKYRVAAEPDCFKLVIDQQHFDSLPMMNRLQASAEIRKVMLIVRGMGLDFYLEGENGK